MPPTCRFAPSATGRAHPGTLLAALLCWLDARARGARLVLRLEDLDPQRCTAELAQGLRADLAWFGLDFDAVEVQSAHGARHAAALDRLAGLGVLYPCALSRSDLQRIGRQAPDGAWASDNRNRGTPLPPGGWRASTQPLRVALPPGVIAPRDLGGMDLAMDPAVACGDPLVRRRDGAVAYQLAVVVDDAAVGVTEVVRGRDIAPGTATQVALQRLLGLPEPLYRHHLLLLEETAAADGHAEAPVRKHSKFHGAVAVPELAGHLGPATLCGFLAWCAGLQPEDRPCTPADLLPDFAWERVATRDVVVGWEGRRLSRGAP